MIPDHNLSKIDLLDGTISLFVSEKFNVKKKKNRYYRNNFF